MAAIETLARTAEHQRAGRHQLAGIPRTGAATGAILKRACGDNCDGNVPVMFLERRVARTGGAKNVGDSPAVTLCQDAGREFARSALRCAAGYCPFEFHRNFYQENAPSEIVKQS
jgi:hypothetical protein